MKISKVQLRQMIKEALNHALNEAVQTSGATGSKSHIEPLHSDSMREIGAAIKSQGKQASDYDFYKDPTTGGFSAHMKGTERRVGQSANLMTATDVGDAFRSEEVVAPDPIAAEVAAKVAADPVKAAELRRDLKQADLEIYPDNPAFFDELRDPPMERGSAEYSGSGYEWVDRQKGTPHLTTGAPKTGEEAIKLEDPEVFKETLKRWKKLIK